MEGVHINPHGICALAGVVLKNGRRQCGNAAFLKVAQLSHQCHLANDHTVI